jgi:hypothetical protein
MPWVITLIAYIQLLWLRNRQLRKRGSVMTEIVKQFCGDHGWVITNIKTSDDATHVKFYHASGTIREYRYCISEHGAWTKLYREIVAEMII